MTEPLISIIIPVYNVENYIEKCIESVLTQTFNDYECILVDDGSLDGSSAICLNFSNNNRKIKYYVKKNGGLSDARNYGINKASGKYLIFLDSDDFFSNDHFLELISIDLLKNPQVIYLNNISYYIDDTMLEEKRKLSKDYYNSIDFYFETQRKKQINTAWRFIVNRDIIVENNLFFCLNIYHEDEEWWPRLINHTNSIFVSNTSSYVYRKNRVGSIMTESIPKKTYDLLFIIDKFSSLSKRNNDIYAFRAADLWFRVFRNLSAMNIVDSEKQNIINLLELKSNIMRNEYFFKKRIVYYIIKIIGLKKTSILIDLLRGLK